MADFKRQKKGKSHVQNMGIFLVAQDNGPEPSCQVSAYKFFSGFNVFFRISTGLFRAGIFTETALHEFICLVEH